MPSFLSLLLQACRLLRTRWIAFFVGVVVFSLLLGGVQTGTAIVRDRYRASLFDDAAIRRDVQLMEELMRDAQDGAENQRMRDVQHRITARLSILSSAAGRSSGYPSAEAGMAAGSLALLVLLLMLSGTYALAVTRPDTSMPRAFAAALTRLPRMLVLCVFGFLVLCLWVPVIGIASARFNVTVIPAGWEDAYALSLFVAYLIAIVVGPRVALAPVFVARGQGGIRAAFGASRGYWWTILFTTLAVVVGLGVVGFIALTVAGPTLASVPFLTSFTRMFMLQACVAMGAAFLASLTDAIVAHPIRSEEETETAEVLPQLESPVLS